MTTSPQKKKQQHFIKEESKKDENEVNKIIKEKDEKADKDINELPYSLAIVQDKRNAITILFSILIQKFELLNIFCGKELMKSMLICEYILSLLINFFINTLLYSDDVVSNKYHNNGELDFFSTLSLSLLANIITSIICYFVKYSEGISEKIELILEIKSERHYFLNLQLLFKFLKIKLVFFIISEIIIICACLYYIVIFCIVYAQSKGSLIINFITSLVEGAITSFAIAMIILIIRKIALSCKNKNMYNISKYINNKF